MAHADATPSPTPFAQPSQLAAPPVIALVVPEIPPYRVHFHRRLVREIPELGIATVITQEKLHGLWDLGDMPELNIHHVADASLAGKALSREERMASDRAKVQRVRDTLETLHRARGVAALISVGQRELPNLAAVRWAQDHRVPRFLWADSNIKGDHAGLIHRLLRHVLLRRLLNSCTGVFPCGTRGRDYFLRYGARPDRVYLSPAEPDYAQIESITPAQIDAARARFNLRPDRRRIVVCNRLVDVKRTDLAIDAFARLAAERPEWDLLIVGDGPLRAQLESRVPAQLRPRVTFAGFVGDQALVSALYRACDVFCIASTYEPWALVVPEACAAGLAIVSSDVVGASADLVRDGFNGRVFASGDLDALTQALRDATAPGHAERSGQNSRRVLATWRAVADPVRAVRHALEDAGVLRPGGGLVPRSAVS
jgi:glycosyltransferase involved in cell wall biosynthesis